MTPLHCAARSGHDLVVRILVDRGAAITSKTKSGLTPLHMAVQGDHVECARILLENRADIEDVTTVIVFSIFRIFCFYIKLLSVIVNIVEML